MLHVMIYEMQHCLILFFLSDVGKIVNMIVTPGDQVPTTRDTLGSS
jgi:hypothetical protein